MKQSVYILLAVMLLTALACGRSVDARLERADALMEDHPDSALAIISAIDTAELRGDRNRAEYGLLLTQARHKCDYVDTDDSLISAAARYFDDHGPARRKMLARFYHAQVLENAGNRSAALARALPVIDLATDLGDTYWLARTHELIGDLYYDSYNMEKAIYYYRLASVYFKQSDHLLSHYYSLVTVARAANHIGRTDESMELLDSINENMQFLDSLAKGFLYESYVRPYMSKKNYYAALDAHKKAMTYIDGYYTNAIVDWMDIATVYRELDSVKQSIDAFEKGLVEINVPAQKYMFIYTTAKAKGDFQKALSNLELSNEASVKAFNNSINQNFDDVFKSYYQKTLDAERQNKNYALIRSYIIVGFLVLALVISFIVYKQKTLAKTRNLELEAYRTSEIITELKKQNDVKKEVILQLSKELKTKSSIFESVQELFNNQLRVSKGLCDEVIAAISNGDKDLNKLYEQLSDARSLLLSDDSLDLLELLADDKSDHKLSRLFELITDFSEKDKRLMIFQKLGFSCKYICVLFNEKPANYYNRLSRIRKRVEKSGNQEAMSLLTSILEV